MLQEPAAKKAFTAFMEKRKADFSLLSELQYAMRMYGIKNCDTVKKARAWLDFHDIPHEFIDFKITPPSAVEIARWCHALGFNVLLNRRGTTWKKLSAGEQSSADSAPGAIAVMVANPSAIKRPIIETGSDYLIGFDEATYQSRFL